MGRLDIQSIQGVREGLKILTPNIKTKRGKQT